MSPITKQIDDAYHELLTLLQSSIAMISELRGDNVQIPYAAFQTQERLAASIEKCQGPGGALADLLNIAKRESSGGSA